MTPAEEKFKEKVLFLHMSGIYPGPTAINLSLNRTRSNKLNGRETKWRREVFYQHGIPYQRPWQVPTVMYG